MYWRRGDRSADSVRHANTALAPRNAVITIAGSIDTAYPTRGPMLTPTLCANNLDIKMNNQYVMYML